MGQTKTVTGTFVPKVPATRRGKVPVTFTSQTRKKPETSSGLFPVWVYCHDELALLTAAEVLITNVVIY